MCYASNEVKNLYYDRSVLDSVQRKFVASSINRGIQIIFFLISFFLSIWEICGG